MSQESDLNELVQLLIDVVKDQGQSMQTFMNHQRDQAESMQTFMNHQRDQGQSLQTLMQTFMQSQQEVLIGVRNDYKELLSHLKSSAPESCTIPSAVKLSQTESVTQLEASLLKIFSNSVVVKNNINITHKLLLNGRETEGGAASAAALICALDAAAHDAHDADRIAAEMLEIIFETAEDDARSHELMDKALQQLRLYKSQEKDCQAALKELTQLGGLCDALDLSKNFIGCPFQLWKTDDAGQEISHNTGQPDVVSTTLPMFLEIKTNRPGHIFEVMKQVVERAYSMISYNCLLQEVVGFASTFAQNWVVRVTRKEKYDSNACVFSYTYEFNFIQLGSAGCIGSYWNALSAAAAATPCRFFHAHWYLLLKSMREAQGIPMFAWAYHKISLEARTASTVYAVHKSSIKRQKGVGEVVESTSNAPIFIVKVNGEVQGQGRRASNEFDVINRLLVEHHGAGGTAASTAGKAHRPHSYPHAPILQLFHVLSCWRWLRGAGGTVAQCCRNERSSKFGLKSMPWLIAEADGGRGEAMEYEALLRMRVQEIGEDPPPSSKAKASAMSKEDIVAACARPCWWNPRPADVEALFAGDGYFPSTHLYCVTLTVMRAGVPLNLAAQICPGLGIDLSPRYIRCRLLRWLQEFCHRASVLHCDSRLANLMVFMYDREEVVQAEAEAAAAAAAPCCSALLQSDSSSSEAMATTLMECSSNGCYIDVQLVDFDLSVVAAAAAAGDDAEVLVEVRPGAQKDLMVDVLLGRARLLDVPSDPATRLPWNMDYDSNMLSKIMPPTMDGKLNSAPASGLSFYTHRLLISAERLPVSRNLSADMDAHAPKDLRIQNQI